MACPGSATLPCNDDKSPNAEKAAAWGTMVHHWAQTGEVKGPTKRTESMFREALASSKLDRQVWWPEGGKHEGSISIRVDGVREVSRDDTVRKGWITGHYDYQYWILEDELWVDDLKTGKYYPNPLPGMPGWNDAIDTGENRFPQNPKSPQPKTYALALSELLGHTGPTHISITHWPREPRAYRLIEPIRMWHTWSRPSLMQHWRDLEELHLEVEHNNRGEDLILRPGDHCRFCPARDNCFVAKEDF